MGHSETFLFTPTRTAFNLTVSITDDSVVENPEAFKVRALLVSAVDAGDVSVLPNSTTVTILDNDSMYTVHT